MRSPAGRVVLALALAVWASVPAPMWCMPELAGGIASCSAGATSCGAACAAPIDDASCGTSCAPSDGIATDACAAGAASEPCPWIPRTDDGRLWCLAAPTPVLGARGDDAPPPDPALAPEAIAEPPAPPAIARAWSAPRVHVPPWAPRHGPPSPRAPPRVA
jgi:hypothetical protein